MKLSFLPGELYLTRAQDGSYVVTVQGDEILSTRVEKKALAKFNAIRRKMELRFPAHEMTPEQKRAALANLIGEFKYTQVRASLKPPKKEKVKGTRTFG
jgi:hypothetical protein